METPLLISKEFIYKFLPRWFQLKNVRPALSNYPVVPRRKSSVQYFRLPFLFRISDDETCSKSVFQALNFANFEAITQNRI